MSMKIKNLKVINVKNVKSLEVSFDWNLTTIAGNNGAGKSTIIDCMRLAILGKSYIGKGRASEAIITHWEDKAEIELRLGNNDKTIKINRVIKSNWSVELSVKSSDVDDDKIQQKELDNLLSAFTIDPLAFNRMIKKEQFEVMKSITWLDFTELDNKRQEIFENRTITNREIKNISGSISEMWDITHIDKIDIAEISQNLTDAIIENQKIVNIENSIQIQENNIANKKAKLDELMKQIDLLGSEISDDEEELRLSNWKLSVMTKIDISELQEKLNQSNENNTKYDIYQKYISSKWELLNKQQEANKMTTEIEVIDQEKAEKMSQAKLPIDNMIFSEQDGIIINNIPLDQYSTAQQMIIACKIATSINSDLKVIYIKDGSLLDNQSLQDLENFANDNDYQIFCERVWEDNFAEIKMVNGEQVNEFIKD